MTEQPPFPKGTRKKSGAPCIGKKSDAPFPKGRFRRFTEGETTEVPKERFCPQTKLLMRRWHGLSRDGDQPPFPKGTRKKSGVILPPSKRDSIGKTSDAHNL